MTTGPQPQTIANKAGNPLANPASLTLQKVSKHYGTLRAADEVELEVQEGEFVTFLGPSGSGKTTTLEIVAGFTKPTSGKVLIDGKPVTAPPHKRDIGMVFQNYALFPHMTAADNVGYPLKVRKISKEERRRRVNEALDMVGLADSGARYPNQLSGGQQQRVALARALVFRPRIVLLDEPLGALDKKLREHLQLEIKRIQHELGITMVYVTHDQEEALVMSDRIAVFNEGRIQQIGTTEEIYEQPASLFVADFIGESNIFQGSLKDNDGTQCIVSGEFRFKIPADASPRIGEGPVALVIRPERLRILGPEAQPEVDENAVEAIVEDVIYLGNERRYTLVTTGGYELVGRHQVGASSDAPLVGTKVLAAWQVEDGIVVPVE